MFFVHKSCTIVLSQLMNMVLQLVQRLSSTRGLLALLVVVGLSKDVTVPLGLLGLAELVRLFGLLGLFKL
jgi:hypothetical protein